MSRSSVSHIGRFSATIQVPGDKSISHRAVILGSLAHGKTVLRHFLEADDCRRTSVRVITEDVYQQEIADRVALVDEPSHTLEVAAEPGYAEEATVQFFGD